MRLFKQVKYQDLSSRYLWVLVYIAYEMGSFIIVGIKLNFWVLTFFYACHISYFFYNALGYIPFIIRRIHSKILRVILSILQGFFYGFLLTALYLFAEFKLTGQIQEKSFFNEMVINCWRGFLFFFLALGFWYSKFSVMKEREAREQEVLKLKAQENELRMETAFLRAQVNPHHLFNTLTVIYGRLLNKAPEEAKTILLLSDMMEYALDQNVTSGMVKLSEDLLQIEREIRLQQVFHNGGLQIDYKVDLDEEMKSSEIPPLLFFNFVQNIFKHGDLKSLSSKAEIRIWNVGRAFYFRAYNKIGYEPNSPSKQTGLLSSRNRLEKHFPENFELSAYREQDWFYVDLKIVL